MVRLKVASEDLVRLGVNESLASSYDDTELRERIEDLEDNKVDKVAGKGLSTNDYTDADKAKVGEVAEIIEEKDGKNLFDATKCSRNKYLNPTTNIISDYNHTDVTDFIPVKSGKRIVVTYTIWGTQRLSTPNTIVFYDASKTFVSGVSNQNKVLIPNGVSFVRLTVGDAVTDYSGQIELTDDGEPTPYQAYEEPKTVLSNTIIENSNIATKEYVDTKRYAMTDIEDTFACALPRSGYFQTVGLSEKWYINNMITPPNSYIEIMSGSKAVRSGQYYEFENSEAYHFANGYKYNFYDAFLGLVRYEDAGTGYGYGRDCVAENLQNCSLLAIGDSTVDQDIMTVKMLDYFTSKGKTLTLLGTLGDGSANNHNEGRAGWSAADYLTNKQYGGVVNPFYNPSTQTFDFSYYMTNQGYTVPTFVVIQLGINDLYNFDETKIEPTWNCIKTMIDSIRNYNSGIKIILNLPTTPNIDQSKHSVFEPAYRNRVIRYNEYVITKIKELYGASKVRCSYCHLILDAETDIRDNVHPTATGYEKMALEIVNQVNNWLD